MKGHHLDDPEIVQELIYWKFAHYFGYTPGQVDALPYDRMAYMLALEQEQNKREIK